MERARDACYLSREEREAIEALLATKDSQIGFEPAELPLPVARALLEDPKVTGRERAVLALRTRGMKSGDVGLEELYEAVVDSPLDFGSLLSGARVQGHGGGAGYNAELQWNGRWYPVVIRAAFHEVDKRVKDVSVEVQLSMGRDTITYSRFVAPALFRDEHGDPATPTALQVLRRLGFRPLQTRAAEHNLRLTKAQRLGSEAGTQVWVRGSVLELGRSWGGALTTVALGTSDVPRRAVVEPMLSDRDEGHYYHPGARGGFEEDVSPLPLVRVFALETKRYVYADVDDVREYDYDDEALSRLVLPDEMRDVLARVFAAGGGDGDGEVFGDLVRGKHGGVVILACGSPGVGKTLTAEVYAEVSRRPLYVLEFGELGTSVEAIERNLETVFERVVRWRAVLQFDECEIFLAERGGDLERSAIVGIFLRMLDYYEGLLFLTTNRPEVLDAAVKSRVMLRLDYPDLDAAARADVWRAMLAAAGLRLDGDVADLAGHDLNGRQIRNLVRLTRIMHPAGDVAVAEVEALMRYGCR